MELQVRLTNLKKSVMKKIGEAATTQSARLISTFSVIANHIEEDEKTLVALEKRLIEYHEQLKKLDQSNLESSGSEIITLSDSKQTNGKQMGQDARRKFVESGPARGYHLSHLGRTIYKTTSGRKVTIPFANEQKPDRWWLGVQDEKYDVIVLLCPRRNGEMLEFIIPTGALAKFWPSLSRHAGQVKFNIIRDAENYYLLVPGSGRESINHFRASYGPLRD